MLEQHKYMLKKILFTFFISLSLMITTSTAVLAQAAEPEEGEAGQTAAFVGESGIAQVEIGTIVATVIKVILSLLALIFVSLMLYAGYLWMTAQGDSGQVDKARGIIMTAAIGLLIVVAAYSITSFVFSSLDKATGSGG
jgi:hypothetical protein